MSECNCEISHFSKKVIFKYANSPFIPQEAATEYIAARTDAVRCVMADHVAFVIQTAQSWRQDIMAPYVEQIDIRTKTTAA